MQECITFNVLQKTTYCRRCDVHAMYIRKGEGEAYGGTSRGGTPQCARRTKPAAIINNPSNRGRGSTGSGRLSNSNDGEEEESEEADSTDGDADDEPVVCLVLRLRGW